MIFTITPKQAPTCNNTHPVLITKEILASDCVKIGTVGASWSVFPIEWETDRAQILSNESIVIFIYTPHAFRKMSLSKE
jgi:hypothetical protein